MENVEISNEERAKMNDLVFELMEREVGVVIQQVFPHRVWINGKLEEVTKAQEEIEQVSRDMWKTTLSINQNLWRESDGDNKEKE